MNEQLPSKPLRVEKAQGVPPPTEKQLPQEPTRVSAEGMPPLEDVGERESSIQDAKKEVIDYLEGLQEGALPSLMTEDVAFELDKQGRVKQVVIGGGFKGKAFYKAAAAVNDTELRENIIKKVHQILIKHGLRSQEQDADQDIRPAPLTTLF